MSKHSVPRVAFRRVWRAVVPPGLRRYGQGAASALARRRVAAALADGEPKFSPGPVIVSGLLAGASGVSRAARLTVRGLQHAGYQPFEHDLAPVFARGDGAASRLPVAPAGGVWLLHVNAPEAVAAMSRISPDAFVGEVVMKTEMTAFLLAAKNRGCRVQVGSDMLFEQIPAYLEYFGLPTTTADVLRDVAQLSY